METRKVYAGKVIQKLDWQGLDNTFSMNEYAFLSKIHNPSIIKVHHILEDKKCYMLVLDYH